MKSISSFLSVSAASAVFLLLSAPSLRAETIFGMTGTSSVGAAVGVALVSFDSATPGSITTLGNFSGVTAGHGLRSIDFRPSTGQLYAISTNATAAQLYTVDLLTALLIPVGGGFVLTGNGSPRVEIDFNPVVDRIRILTGSSGATGLANNFRAHPDTGALLFTDTNLAYDPADSQAGINSFSVNGAAHSNNVAGATSTTLYTWEYETDTLATLGGIGGTPSPNGGAMFTINIPSAPLTFNAGLGMDISGATGVMYVTHDNPGAGAFMGLYTRNLLTGAETSLGSYASGFFINDISVQPIPEPAVSLFCGLAGLAVATRRRRA